VKPAVHFRTLTATARAAATGLANIALGRVELRSDVQLRAGDVAPDFDLSASDGRHYKLSDFRGRQAVVVAWFPRAFTPGCTAECRSLGTNKAALRALNAQFFAASVDSSDTNAEFARSLDLAFPILSDETGETARAYGVLSRSGFPSRWTFYIGLDGRILDIDRQVRASTHGSDVAARLRELGIS
jgi:thioredoxin-dependent peroxiredoxin